MSRRLAAEFIGTLWLVLGGCGAAVLAAAFPQVGIGFVGVAFAFGLTVLTMAYAIGHVSGGHLNPAVSVGLWAGGRFPAGDSFPTSSPRCSAPLPARRSSIVIASGKAGFESTRGFAANGYGEHSPGGYSLSPALVCRSSDDLRFLFVILGSTAWPCAERLRADRHRPLPDADPSHQHPGHQHFGQSGAQHRPRSIRGGLGARPALAVLGGAARRRASWRASSIAGSAAKSRHRSK